MPREGRVTLGVYALGKAQAHQQIFVGLLGAGQRLVGDDAVAVRLDAHQPRFRTLLGRRRVARAVDEQPAMCAWSNAGIFVIAPVDEIVPALGTRPSVV